MVRHQGVHIVHQMAVKEVFTVGDFDASLGKNSCVFFWAAWHEPSKPGGQMDEVTVNSYTPPGFFAPTFFFVSRTGAIVALRLGHKSYSK